MEIDIPDSELKRIGPDFTKLVKEPSERSAIIVLSARIESLVEDVAERLFPGLGFSGHQRRLDALRSIDVIDDQIFQILKALAAIRNHYAHSYDDCSLKDPKIIDHVRNFFAARDVLFQATRDKKQFEEGFTDQLAARGITSMPAWFTSNLNELFATFIVLAPYLMALARLPVSRPPKLSWGSFMIRPLVTV